MQGNLDPRKRGAVPSSRPNPRGKSQPQRMRPSREVHIPQRRDTYQNGTRLSQRGDTSGRATHTNVQVAQRGNVASRATRDGQSPQRRYTSSEARRDNVPQRRYPENRPRGNVQLVRRNDSSPQIRDNRVRRRTVEKSSPVTYSSQIRSVLRIDEESRMRRRERRIEDAKRQAEKDEIIEKRRNLGIVRVTSGVDHVMLTLILTLLCLGTIMVFSASYPSALAQKNDSLYFLRRQGLYAGMGLVAMIVCTAIPYKFYRSISIIAYGFAMVLLALVLVVGMSEGEAKRWLGVPNTPLSVQPSEIMKVALVLILAWYIEKHKDDVQGRLGGFKSVFRGVGVPILLVGCACMMVLLEKHLSGTIILGLIGFIVMIIGGCHIGWTVGIFGVGGLVGGGAFLLANPYALTRITTKLNENADVLREKWQTTQGMYAIGSGGPFGRGLGLSWQKYSYVSAAQNDFIFTIWCEEMGFVGAVVLICLYLLFLWRGYKIAMHAPDTFSALTVFGIVSKVGIQAFLNIAVVCDVIPNTGVSLPFFSYGGSALVILMAEMGIVLSISKHSYQKK